MIERRWGRLAAWLASRFPRRRSVMADKKDDKKDDKATEKKEAEKTPEPAPVPNAMGV